MATRKPIYSLIHEDHTQIETLFDALRDTGPREIELRRRMLSQLTERLLEHGQVEETLHSVFQRPYGTADAVCEAREQFRQVRALLEELQTMPLDDTDWWEKLDLLQRAFGDHVRAEEGSVFVLAQAVLDGCQAEHLGEEMQQLRRVRRSTL